MAELGEVGTGDLTIAQEVEYLAQLDDKYGEAKAAGAGAAGAEAAPAAVTVLKYHSTPLDYSFCDLSSLEGLPGVVPRGGPRPVLQRLAKEKAARAAEALAAEQEEAGTSRKKAPSAAADAAGEGAAGEGEEGEEAAAPEESAPAAPARVEIPTSTALRLNNNTVSALETLPQSLGAVRLVPQKLQWLDLSFNAIETVEPIVEACPALKLLYLHVNAISDAKQLDLLAALSHLHTLT